jgi:predicted xylose isomerase-like sugar epimerase
MLVTDARFGRILYVINDCRDADVSSLSDDFLNGFRSDQEVAAVLNPNRIIANVLSTEDAERIRRLHDERYSGLVKMKTFASIDEAREWVNEWVRLQGR